ncbi:hypothetical protein QAD02_008570 [Eretmocerus hayati]|uniref:Uncharacterized protein n=2 Tax=Eretmocerus hayati TaxID=131215 RepID=A0ACC2N6Z3_9HYME|nr:hypothetical protein QAD02_008566 [Eretmocerus hayati]KAJ8666908.1 hypothetical protein QAD02_008570 [Eretmocerus hayati]
MQLSLGAPAGWREPGQPADGLFGVLQGSGPAGPAKPINTGQRHSQAGGGSLPASAVTEPGGPGDEDEVAVAGCSVQDRSFRSSAGWHGWAHREPGPPALGRCSAVVAVPVAAGAWGLLSRTRAAALLPNNIDNADGGTMKLCLSLAFDNQHIQRPVQPPSKERKSHTHFARGHRPRDDDVGSEGRGQETTYSMQ